KIAYNILKYTDIVLSGSYLSAKNTDTGQGLVYMPANNLRAEINLEYPNPQSHSVIKNFNFTGGVLHNFKKTDIDENQDFLPVPEAYSLLYLSLGGDFRVSEKTLSVTLKVDNLLNTKYRDYLNRLHYFADEMGRNISMNLSYEF
ncbi:MAG TPA: TonB-dependent receptor, partial [Saprospiraceae bacterium]|nr:TonB-dependent receptor [Saprospiraceae bacterium]